MLLDVEERLEPSVSDYLFAKEGARIQIFVVKADAMVAREAIGDTQC